MDAGTSFNGHRRRRGRPEKIDPEAASRTDRLLARLPGQDWTVLSDVDRRHGLDHVAVGPSGVFAFSSHRPQRAGAARVKDGVVLLRKGTDSRAERPGLAINRRALEAASALRREIRTRTGRGPTVHPVVVLWCDFPQRVAESSQLAFVGGRDLLSWLAARPPELDEPGRAEVARALQEMPHDRLLWHRWRAPHIGPRRRAA